ncbi:hypothetical protein GCM10007874_36120 [Labrys miyagiensis]|uniref:Uncharacterized protein n=1 Tax=Labrys miyagiensis TaxID=346912 RepID=A0ABQ6CL90_9HYPH|nr:hypothetical protein GCM10007874_36120 [Labrys miyagiensis]
MAMPRALHDDHPTLTRNDLTARALARICGYNRGLVKNAFVRIHILAPLRKHGRIGTMNEGKPNIFVSTDEGRAVVAASGA